MPTATEHALLSASSAHRWLVCTAAPRYESQFPYQSSGYANEGTLAHSICELYARREFLGMPIDQFNSAIKAHKTSKLYSPQMLKTAEFYVQHIKEMSLRLFKEPPHIALEVRVNLSEWIPEGFGTCDEAMLGGDTLHITDYKHGEGVVVDAENNPQMMLYALGALNRYRVIYGDRIKRVSMSICQPRVTEDCSHTIMTVEDLLAWGETVKPIAKAAFEGNGVFIAGEHCRFCRGKNVCPARRDTALAAEEFLPKVVKSLAVPPYDPEARKAAGLPPILTNEEIAEALIRGKTLSKWMEDLEKYALQAILNGEKIPGFKVTEGRSTRAFKDPDKAIQLIIDSGVDPAMCYVRNPKSLTALEELLGKKRFSEVCGSEIFKAPGKPKLAAESSKRPKFDSAKSDFGGSA